MSNVENVRQMYQHQNKWYPKGIYLPLSKLRSILAVANLHHSHIVRVMSIGTLIEKLSQCESDVNWDLNL